MKCVLNVICAVAIVACFGCDPNKSSNSSSPNQAPQTTTIDSTQNTPYEAPKLLDKSIHKGKLDPERASDVRKTFDEFKRAIGRYDGKTASAMLARESLDYYANILETLKLKVFQPDNYKALEDRIPTSVRTNVDIMAQRLSPQFIAQATPIKLYETAFDQGWIGYQSMQSASIDDLQLYDRDGQEYVLADFLTSGSFRDKLWARIGFYYQGDSWKIDLVPIFITVQKSIDDFIIQNFYHPDASIEGTVRETVESSNPGQWRRFVYKKDGFAAKFPRVPLYSEDSGWRIYTSMHHLFGQFDVRVRDYDNDQSQLYTSPDMRKSYIYGNLSAIDAQSIRCRDLADGEVKIVMCNFDVTQKSSTGKTIWYFTPNHVYLLLNIAPTASYSEDSAVAFAEGFEI